nr:uncharacterized protein LOC123760905 [Procambarus clarkii]
MNNETVLTGRNNDGAVADDPTWIILVGVASVGLVVVVAVIYLIVTFIKSGGRVGQAAMVLDPRAMSPAGTIRSVPDTSAFITHDDASLGSPHWTLNKDGHLRSQEDSRHAPSAVGNSQYHRDISVDSGNHKLSNTLGHGGHNSAYNEEIQNNSVGSTSRQHHDDDIYVNTRDLAAQYVADTQDDYEYLQNATTPDQSVYDYPPQNPTPARNIGLTEQSIYDYPRQKQNTAQDPSIYDYPQQNTNVVRDSSIYDYPQQNTNVVRDSSIYDYPQQNTNVVRDSSIYDYPQQNLKVAQDSNIYDYPRQNQISKQDSSPYDCPRQNVNMPQDSSIYDYPPHKQSTVGQSVVSDTQARDPAPVGATAAPPRPPKPSARIK